MNQLYTTMFAAGLLAISSKSWAQSDQSTFLGYLAGNNTMTGQANTFIGNLTGYQNSTGYQNTFIGTRAGYSNTSGQSNTFIGFLAGSSTNTGVGNTFLGVGTGLANTNGSNNTFIGSNTGVSNSTGASNVFIGTQAGVQNATGTSNLFMGTLSGYYNNGSNNVFLGNGAGLENSTGSGNVFIGSNAGQHNTIGGSNIFLGGAAGLTNTSGANNILFGNGANTGSANLSNAIAIGTNAQVNASNSLILGNGVNVGIGNTAPNNKLEITQGSPNQSGLRFTNLTNSSPASVTNQYKFLTVNSSGDVVLGSLNGSAREGVSSTLWSATGDYVQNANTGGVIIGDGVNKTPSDYNLFVSKGILTEKVKVAVKNTADWSDKVFESGYSLRGLPEVAGYIKTHKHLPGIPSAQEMVEQGNDLHQTDAKLLEKIEELTLYLIEQRNELQSLRQQNRQINEQNKLIRKRMADLEKIVNH